MTDIFEKCKRTHYSNEIGPELAGETVKVTGWVHEIRDLGGIVFVLIRDKNGITQLTAPSKKLSEEMMADVRAARKETIITLTGTVQESAKAPNGVEIIPSNIDVINVSQLPLPLDTTEKVEAEMDTRLDSRFMDLRKHDVSAIFKIKSQMLHTARNYFYDNDFTEITTPKLVASATEGGTELFPITYFEKEAFLGQSPQLYKQMMMATGLDNVFEIGQIFRAEEHDTLRHLNEALSIDAEMSFKSQTDAMNTLEELIKRKPVFIEMGLQTSHDSTASFLNRAYPTETFTKTCHALAEAGIRVTAHIILGLPGETLDMELDTIRYLTTLTESGIKISMLYVLKNTVLASYYEQHPFHILTMEEYINHLIICLSQLRKDIVIERMTGDGPKDLLIVPKWIGHKRLVLNTIHKEMKQRNFTQGGSLCQKNL